MTAPPRLTVGLPVYNGDQYLPGSLDALLGQSFADFELLISDNASTDGTEEICRQYAASDDRIRYHRQPRNMGISENHNAVVRLARGDLFKWAGHDDLFARDLLGRCVELLDEHPDAVLATSWTAIIDDADRVTDVVTQYPSGSDSPHAVERYRGMLNAITGDDDYGVMRIDVLRHTPLLDSFYHADRALVAELTLHGKFLRVPEPLYFRRDLADRVSRPSSDRRRQAIRDWCAKHDPRRADPIRHPTARLLAEYLRAFFAGIARAPLAPADKRACYRELISYLSGRGFRRPTPPQVQPVPPIEPALLDVVARVPGRKSAHR